MLRDEFETFTGIYPPVIMYEAIEAAYTAFSGDKESFCLAFKNNVNGMAGAIQRKCDMEHTKSFAVPMAEKDRQITELHQSIALLKEQLDLELEWKPYEFPHNVPQMSYERLASCVPHSAHYMTDEEAIAWICRNFDFDPRKVKILHEIKGEEINRHNLCRPSKIIIDRRPIYHATDYLYIRFDTTHDQYEAWEDNFRVFLC